MSAIQAQASLCSAETPEKGEAQAMTAARPISSCGSFLFVRLDRRRFRAMCLWPWKTARTMALYISPSSISRWQFCSTPISLRDQPQRLRHSCLFSGYSVLTPSKAGNSMASTISLTASLNISWLVFVSGSISLSSYIVNSFAQIELTPRYLRSRPLPTMPSPAACASMRSISVHTSTNQGSL